MDEESGQAGWPESDVANPEQVLPGLVIGGAPRSGTTFLCELLSRHPQAYVARPFIPEPKVLFMPPPNGDAGIIERYARLFKDAPVGRLRVEKSSHYLENAGALERFTRLLPRARAVFILRDPVARAYSNWQRSTANGLETLSFEDAIAGEGKRKDPFEPERDYVRPFDYVTRSCYGSFVRDWIDALGRERVCVLQLDDAVAAPERLAGQLLNFAGLEPLPWSSLNPGVVNAGPGGNTPEFSPEVAALLRERLAPEMALLAQMTGLDVGRWGF